MRRPSLLLLERRTAIATARVPDHAERGGAEGRAEQEQRVEERAAGGGAAAGAEPPSKSNNAAAVSSSAALGVSASGWPRPGGWRCGEPQRHVTRLAFSTSSRRH